MTPAITESDELNNDTDAFEENLIPESPEPRETEVKQSMKTDVKNTKSGIKKPAAQKSKRETAPKVDTKGQKDALSAAEFYL